jgi:hypothetical protein
MPLKAKPALLVAPVSEELSSGRNDNLRYAQSQTKLQALSERTIYTVDRWLHVEVRA